MGYLDGLIDPAFKEQEDGKTVFFPSGILAPGRVLSDDQMEATIRRQLRHGYIWGFTSMLTLFAVGKVLWPRWGWLLPAGMVPAWIAWYQIAVVGKLRDLPVAGAKLTLRESAERQSVALGWIWLSFLAACSTGLFLFSGYALLVAAELQPILLLAVLLFGVCTALQLYQLVLKIRSRLGRGA